MTSYYYKLRKGNKMSVYEEKGKWYYLFMMNGQRKHGRCYGCTNKKDAGEFENDTKYQLSLIQRGKVKNEKKFTFVEMMNNYKRYSEANKKSYYKDITYIKYLTNYFGKNTDIAKIKPLTIENFKYH